MDDFETFTRERITRLRAEADALDKTLKEYLGARARASGAARRSGGDNPRSGAFGVVMDAILGAGPEGLNLDEMTAAAEAEGYEIKRNTLRSQVWQAKNDRQLVQIAQGRYRAPSDLFEQVVPALGKHAEKTRAFLGVDTDDWDKLPKGAPQQSTFSSPADEEEEVDDEIPF